MEKAVILGLGVDKTGSSSALGDLLARQAEELASSGQLSAAYDLLCLVPGESSTKASDLRDRLYQGGATEQNAQEAQTAYQPADQSWAAEPSQLHSHETQSYYAASNSAAVERPSAPSQFEVPQQQQQAYKPSPPATPFSTSSSSMQQFNSAANQGFSTGYAPSAPPQMQVFTPAQPQQISAPPKAFVGSDVQPPPTVSTFQPTAPQSIGPPSAPPMAPQTSFGGTGGIGAAGGVTSPHMPTSPAARVPQVYQYVSETQPSQGYGSTAGSTVPPQQQQQQEYVPSAPPQVYQPAQPGLVIGQQPQQSQAARTSAPPTPAAPTGPPADVALMTVDVSQVAPNLNGIIHSLRSLYQGAEPIASAQPARRRELDDASKKLGGLLWKLNRGMISESVVGKLQQLCHALDTFDYATAAHVQVMLTTSDWDECSSWLTALKRLIKLRQMG